MEADASAVVVEIASRGARQFASLYTSLVRMSRSHPSFRLPLDLPHWAIVAVLSVAPEVKISAFYLADPSTSPVPRDLVGADDDVPDAIAQFFWDVATALVRKEISRAAMAWYESAPQRSDAVLRRIRRSEVCDSMLRDAPGRDRAKRWKLLPVAADGGCQFTAIQTWINAWALWELRALPMLRAAHGVVFAGDRSLATLRQLAQLECSYDVSRAFAHHFVDGMHPSTILQGNALRLEAVEFWLDWDKPSPSGMPRKEVLGMMLADVAMAPFADGAGEASVSFSSTQARCVLQYLASMTQWGAWGDQCTLLAMAERRGLHVHVLERRAHAHLHEGSCFGEEGSGRTCFVVYSGPADSGHYDAALPMHFAAALSCARCMRAVDL
jgi:hypothetical protein